MVAGAASAQSKETMKIASNTAPDHHYNIGAKKFADLMTERTKGRIDFKIYPAGQLGKGEREVTEGLQQGSIDLQVTSTGPLGGFSQSILILDFPYLFRDYDHVDLVLDGPIGQKLLNDFEKANIKALAFWENGFRHLTNSKQRSRPSTTPRASKSAPWKTRFTWRHGRVPASTRPPWPSARYSPPFSRR